MPAGDTTLDRAIASMRADADLELRRPATDAAIEAFESRYGVRLPADMRAFYTTAGGMERGYCWSDAPMAIWSLDEIEPVEAYLGRPVEPAAGCPMTRDDADAWFCFADHLLECVTYAIRLDADATASTPVVDAHEPRGTVAASFTDFLRRCLDEPASLY